MKRHGIILVSNENSLTLSYIEFYLDIRDCCLGDGKTQYHQVLKFEGFCFRQGIYMVDKMKDVDLDP